MNSERFGGARRTKALHIEVSSLGYVTRLGKKSTLSFDDFYVLGSKVSMTNVV